MDVRVTCIEIEVENVGPVSAANCHGLVYFSKEPALPLRPCTKGIVNTQLDSIIIEPLTKQVFVAAWTIDPSGAIIADSPITYGQFVDKYMPAKIVLEYANTSIEEKISAKDLRSAYERLQRS